MFVEDGDATVDPLPRVARRPSRPPARDLAAPVPVDG
jgi:hypothetical protein